MTLDKVPLRPFEFSEFDEQWLNVILSTAQVGVWESDLINHRSWRSLRHAQIFGYEDSRAEWSAEIFLEHILQEDRRIILQERTNDDFRREFRIRRANDKAIRWISGTGRTFRDEKGQAVRMLGTVVDITEQKESELALSRSESRYRSLFETAGVGIMIFEADTGRLIDANLFVTDILACSREALIGKKLWELGFPEDVVRSTRAFAELQKAGYLRYEDLRLRSSRGQCIDLDFIGTAYDIGEQKLIQCSMRDVSLHKLSEKAARVSQDQLSAFFNGSPFGMAILDRQLRYLKINEVLARMNQLPVRDHFGKTPAEIVPQIASQIEPNLRKVIETGRPLLNVEVSGSNPSHTDVCLLSSYFPVPIMGEETFQLGVVTADITQQKRAEKEILSLAKFPSEDPSPVLRLSESGTVIYANESSQPVLRLWGCAVGSIAPSFWRKLVSEVFRNKLEKTIEIQIGVQTYSFVVAPIIDAGYVNLYGRDITERKRDEMHIRKLDQLLRAIRDINRLIVCERDVQKLLDAACEILVQTRDYRLVWIGFAEGDSKRVVPVARGGRETKYLDEVTITWDESATGHGPVGTAIRKVAPCVIHNTAIDPLFAPWRERALASGYLSVAAVPIIQGTGLYGVVSVYAEIPDAFDDDEVRLLNELAGDLGFALQSIEDERKRHEAEDRYRRLFEENLAGVYVSDPAGPILTCNMSFAKMFGFSSIEEVIGHDFSAFYPQSEKRTEFLSRLRTHIAINAEEKELRRKDGKILHVTENATGDFDERGNLIEIHGYLVDDTARRTAEEQARQAQKMEAIGQLAGGVAHDFNNLLTVINGYSDLLLSDLAQDDPRRNDLAQIRKAGSRAASLTSQLLAFSRKQLIQPRILNLNEVIAETGNILRRLIGEDINLLIVPESELGLVRADPGQIGQVIMNLAVNSRDAMPQGGRLMLSTANFTMDEEFAKVHRGASPGRYVMLTVSDNGVGMAPETQSHLFEPFFTTKALGKGTGLGLSTVYGIVKQSEGYISIDSDLGKGSTFRIYFPRVEGTAQRIKDPGSEESPRRGTETVLVVEDEHSVRELTAQILRNQGYTVLEAVSGREALRIVQEVPAEIRLVVSDVVMPEIGGPELVSQLESKHPGIAALYISGYTKDAIVHHGVLDSKIAFLQKPFTAEDLVRKVREAIDRK